MKEAKEKKGTLNDLVKRFVAQKINQYLGKYLSNIKNEDLQTNIGTNSAITLNNLQLRKDAFDDLRLPIEVDPSSIVKELRCELRMLPLQVNIYVKGIKAIVLPNSKSWSPAQWKEYKKKHLEDWQESQKNLFASLNLKNYKQRKISMVANNINITIEDVIIYYKDTQALGSPCIIRFRLEELRIATTTEDFSKEKPSNSEFTTYRKISVKDFSLAIHSEYSDLISDNDIEDKRFSERMYILRPCNMNFYYTMQHKPLENTPTHSLKIEISNMVVSLSELQRQFIESLNMIMKNQTHYKAYEENHPVGKVIGNEQNWWNYLIKTCKKDLDMNVAGLIRNKQDMDKYIDYYKSCQEIIHAPWLSDRTREKEDFLDEIEEEYPLDKLISFRTLALYQLRIEAMSYVKARGNVRGKMHLGDLWDYYLNDFESLLGDPYKTVAEEHEIELTLEEKEELNHLLKMDTLNIVDSYLNGASSSRNDKMLDLTLNLAKITFFIQEAQVNDEFLYKTINKKDCICLRCSENSLSPNRNSENMSGMNDERKTQAQDAVYSILMVNQQGKAYDPKLVKEHTLLIVEANLKGSIMIYRDKHIITDNDIKIGNLEIWDPLSLQEPDEMKLFKDKYGFTKGDDLLSMILIGKNEEFSLINSIRFFMQEMNLIPEFEFVLHLDKMFDQVSHFCTCKSIYSTLSLQKEAFLNPNSKFCLHLTEAQLEKYQNATDLKELYNIIREFMNNRVMPRFMRNCARWIITNSLNSKTSTSNSIYIKLKLKGNSSPIEVQFVDRKKRKIEENQLEEKIEQSKIDISSKNIKAVMSTETVHSLIRWFMKSHENFEFQKSFISTLNSFSPKLEYIKNILNNMKKSGQQLYFIAKEKQKSVDISDITVTINEVIIKLVETIFTNSKNKQIISTVEMKDFILKIGSVNDQQQEVNDFNKGDFIRDSKFYVSTIIDLKSLMIHTMLQPVLSLDIINFNSKDCIMKGHPYLIENITESNIKNVKIFIRKELLSFLGLVSSLDFKPLKHLSKDNIVIRSLQKEIYKHDKNFMTKRLLNYQNDHFLRKNLKKCRHCMLAYRKIIKNFSLSIGDPEKKSTGLELFFYSFKTKDKSISLKCPRVIIMTEERIFNSSLSVFTTDFENNEIFSLKFTDKNFDNKFDPNDISPLFSSLAHKSTPSTCYVSGTLHNDAISPLRLIFKSHQRKNIKIFDENLWRIRESLYEKNIVNLKPYVNENNLCNFMTYDCFNQNYAYENRKNYKPVDCFELMIEEFRVNIKENNDYNFAISALFSVVSLVQLYLKYMQSVKITQMKKNNLVSSKIVLNKFIICSMCKDKEFCIEINGLKIKGIPSFMKSTMENYEKKDFFEDALLFNNKKHKKREVIEDISHITAKDFVFRIGKDTYFKIENLSTVIKDTVKQVKNYSKELKKVGNHVKSKKNEINIRIKTISFYQKKSKNKIFAIPVSYNHSSKFKINKDEIACTLDIMSKTKTNSINRKFHADFGRVGMNLSCNTLSVILNNFFYISDPISNSKTLRILSVPEKYTFYSMKYLEITPFKTKIRITNIRSEVSLNDIEICRIVVRKMKMNNKNDKKQFEGSLRSFQILSKNGLYPKTIVPSDPSSRVITSFIILENPDESIFRMTIENSKVVFLEKFIEQNIHVYNFINQEILKPREKKSENIKTSTKPTSVEIIFVKGAILIPKASYLTDNLTVNFNKAHIKTISNEISYWKPPVLDEPTIFDIKEVSLASVTSEISVNCTQIDINLDNMHLIFNGDYLGSAAEAKLEVFVPIIPDKAAYILKSKVSIEVIKAKLCVSLGKMKLLEELINKNIDEPLENLPKIMKSKNTKFRFKVTSGTMSINRWVTLPFEKPPAARIVVCEAKEDVESEENNEMEESFNSLSLKSNDLLQEISDIDSPNNHGPIRDIFEAKMIKIPKLDLPNLVPSLIFSQKKLPSMQ
ncbi:hypothetical protein SteCoe_20353 [Stentor coeruleus]|uniref:Chorein N-terminal domain-containing protein n=1 Tax=Stentor coeruleus TaxID=5963 RepID=A0A1R2BSM3_9CILI|nr:hypothetical protein SteCoe_20353 [Stentor coeruleus]